MTFKQYIPLAIRTLHDLGSRKDNLAHMGLGLGSELLEYYIAVDVIGEDNPHEDKPDVEIGDLYWFTAATFHILRISYDPHSAFRTDRDIKVHVSGVIDHIKKHVAYGIPIIDERRWFDRAKKSAFKNFNKKFVSIEEISNHLHALVYYCGRLCDVHKLEVSDVLETNINKLRKRFPKGYTDYHAAIRLDKNESKTANP